MIRYSLFIFILLALVFTSPEMTTAAAPRQAVFVVDSRSYMINGTVLPLDAAPYIEQDRVFIPLRELARALGVEDKNVIWHAPSKSVELHLFNNHIKLTVNNHTLLVNQRISRMDVAPVLVSGRVYLPARHVAEALGYAIGWAEKERAVLIGLPGHLPDPASIPPEMLPVNIRACVFPASGIYFQQKRSASAILFHGDQANVYNAGVAAKYVNGLVLEPGQVFSFNRVVGERTKSRGFVTGYDILDNLTVGGGVCRTSTVLFQAARDAGLVILERHPHSRPVHYTPPGTDASVSWGWMDLKFKNNLPYPLLISAGLNEETGGGRRLWAELHAQIPLTKIEVAVLRQKPDAGRTKDRAESQLTALEKEGVVYVSLEQLSDLFHCNPEIKRQGEGTSVSVKINSQSISLLEGSLAANVNGAAHQLAGAPFCLSGCNCTFWLPLEDLAALFGTEIMQVDGTPALLWNLSGASVAEEQAEER